MGTDPNQASSGSVRLILVRHAEHLDFGQRLTGRAPGVPLSAAGRRQAEHLARHFAAEPVTEVQTSPRERACDTAAAIARACGADLSVTDALDEIDFGDWTGARFDALAGRPEWTEWNCRRGSARIPGGESMSEATNRIAGHVAGLAAERAGASVALVTHCDMIRGLVAHCLGLSLDYILRFEIGPGSITRVEAAEWGARVISLNEQPSQAACPQ